MVMKLDLWHVKLEIIESLCWSQVQSLPTCIGGWIIEFNASDCLLSWRSFELCNDLSYCFLKVVVNFKSYQHLFVGATFKKLRVLNISNTRLEDFSEDWGQLKSLQEFNANHCSFLSSIPNIFGDMSNLKKIESPWLWPSYIYLVGSRKCH